MELYGYQQTLARLQLALEKAQDSYTEINTTRCAADSYVSYICIVGRRAGRMVSWVGGGEGRCGKVQHRFTLLARQGTCQAHTTLKRSEFLSSADAGQGRRLLSAAHATQAGGGG